ncbi:MAG: hypothetical protein ACPG7E_00830 [Marinirhabdus sp.]
MKDTHKHTGYITPPDYFQLFETDLKNRLSTQGLPKKPGYTLPPDYFEMVEGPIFKKISKKPKHTAVRPVAYIAAIAASVVLVVSLFVQKPSAGVSWQSLSAEDISSYIISGGIEMNTTDLAQLFKDEEINTLQNFTSTLNSNTLEDYLLETIDEATLETE